MKQPTVTVLMPVYNGEKYLREAIESILTQTYTSFEFLIINDGSTDESMDIINSYSDPRIRLINNENNIKLIATLNKGLGLARGKYVARMDCDDVVLPKRLERQVAFMEQNPDVGICGTWVETIRGNNGEVWKYPTDSDVIKCNMLFNSVLAHPSVMLRQKLLKKYKLMYEPGYLHAEDLQLWRKASHVFKLANLGEVLMFYRVTSNSVSRLNAETQIKTIERMDCEAISKLGIAPSKSELLLHHRLSYCKFVKDRAFLEETETWLLKLIAANAISRLYPENTFRIVLSERWFYVCSSLASLGFWVWIRFRRSQLSLYSKLRFFESGKLFVFCAISR